MYEKLLKVYLSVAPDGMLTWEKQICLKMQQRQSNAK